MVSLIEGEYISLNWLCQSKDMIVTVSIIEKKRY